MGNTYSTNPAKSLPANLKVMGGAAIIFVVANNGIKKSAIACFQPLVIPIIDNCPLAPDRATQSLANGQLV
jgi:hypothetical protein